MRRLNLKTIWKGRHIQAVLIEYAGSDGKTREWEAVKRTYASDVVIIVPFTSEGELLLIKQYRPALDRFVIELPAGLVDKGEAMEEAAERELLEETGHIPGRTTLLLTTAMSSGIHSEPWHVFLATGSTPASIEDLASCEPDDNEEIETLRIPLDGYKRSLRELSAKGEMVDIRIFGLVEMALDRLKEEADGSA
jgi:ADP-ribose pyrophosphatase